MHNQTQCLQVRHFMQYLSLMFLIRCLDHTLQQFPRMVMGINARLLCVLLVLQAIPLYGLFDFNDINISDIWKNLVALIAKTPIGAAKFAVDSVKFSKDEYPDTTPQSRATYDFIIIGGGSAGCTLAARLSEIPNATVLLLEAGGHESLINDLPVLAFLNQFNPPINWYYLTEPSEKYCRGMINHQCHWARGKVLGGTSVLNFMLATRGFPKEYNEWAADGNAGWSWDDVLPYFKKLETIEIPELRNDKNHNTNGPYNISYLRYQTDICKAFLKAGQEMGYKLVEYNGYPEVGFSNFQVTISEGTRMSANRAYLHKIKSRENLHVSINSVVTKILINSQNRAYAVEFKKGKRKYTIYAKKEVILSAGTVASPQILMLSGVGPAQHLQEFDIAVKKDLPVGENLMDHPIYAGLIYLINKTAGIGFTDALKPEVISDFLLKRENIWTLSQGGEATGLVNVESDIKEGGYPDIELFLFSTTVPVGAFLRNTMHISDEVYNKHFAMCNNKPSWSAFPMLFYPKSRGKILLKSADINDHPRIIPNYMDHPDDRKVLIKGIRKSIELSRTPAMQKYNSTVVPIMYDECKDYEYDSDEYWECTFQILLMPGYHFAGSCKMGPENDTTSVVNWRLKVIGIDGLRVIDASIFPSHVAAHTNIPTVMVAEKGADMIKEDWGYATDPLQ